MSKATPGPWCVRDMPTQSLYIGPCADGTAPSVALVMERVNVPESERWANARLIAEAPSMLDCLRHVVHWHDQLMPHDIALIQDVIDRAERSK